MRCRICKYKRLCGLVVQLKKFKINQTFHAGVNLPPPFFMTPNILFLLFALGCEVTDLIATWSGIKEMYTEYLKYIQIFLCVIFG